MPSVIRRPPGPRNLPVIGNLRPFRANPLEFIRKAAREYGDLAYFRVVKQHLYVVGHPDYVREILVTKQNNFVKSRALQRAKILLGEGLLTSEGEHHLRQRRLVQPAFHRDRLAGYAAAMSECVVKARERWQPGVSMDVSVEMAKLTLSVVAKTLFSADIDAEAHEIGEAMTSILHMFKVLLMPFSEHLDKLPLPMMKRFETARARLDATIYGLIAERRASGADTGDLLSMLLLAQEEGDEMTDQQVRDEAITLFLAGHETGANALTWSWYLLSQHPDVERRLHEEVDRVLGDRAPELADVPHLRYAEMILSEALRLYPPAWAIGRKAIADFSLGGYDIPAGSIFIVSPYVVQHDARWFPNPDRFDPERWTPEAREARPKFSYFPFGGGARVCIGERFAWMEGVILLAAIAQKWRFRLTPGQHVEPLPLVTLRVKNGLRMIAEPRVAAGLQGELPQDGSGGRAIAAHDLQRQA
ncbi:MAG TPA: cytochrome P450 [Bryobacteraceae bacterium]|nr:cytochrome P450 [Bryobacteraceae bacterium]